MALRKITTMGDECLSKVCRPVKDFNKRLWELLDDIETIIADYRALWLKRVTLVGHLEHASLPAAWTGETDSMAAALRLLAGRPGLGDLLVTHTFPPESLPRALEVARDRSRHHAVKVALARALPNDTTVTR